MTARRQNGTTVDRTDSTTPKEVVTVPPKKRAGSARSAFARAGVGKAEPQLATEDSGVAGDAAAALDEGQAAESKSKFTVLLDGDEAANFDSLALVLRRRLGRVVKKSDIVRALIALASDDQTLTAQLETELHRRK